MTVNFSEEEVFGGGFKVVHQVWATGQSEDEDNDFGADLSLVRVSSIKSPLSQVPEFECSESLLVRFSQCSTHLGFLGLIMAKYCQFWAKRAYFERFWGPQLPFLFGPKGPNQPPPDVKYNVQPCSTSVQPIWGCWDCLWPNIAIKL